MADVKDKTFGAADEVRIDGNSYTSCTFKAGCSLIYAGGPEPIGFKDCDFSGDVCWVFEGAASQTLNFLRGMHANGNTRLTQALINTVTGADTPNAAQLKLFS